MEKIEVELYILKNVQDALRLSTNALDSMKRETAMDRQIEYSERLINWVLNGRVGEVPKWIPPPLPINAQSNNAHFGNLPVASSIPCHEYHGRALVFKCATVCARLQNCKLSLQTNPNQR